MEVFAKRRRRLRQLGIAVFVLVFMAAFSWAGYAASYLYPLFWGGLAAQGTAAGGSGGDGKYTLLILGSDRRAGEGAGRSDTMMAVYVDTENKTVRLVSIPRDTLVEIPGTEEKTKINHAYAYGGVDLALETLRRNFGIAADYYIDIDFDGFAGVIDTIGGVDFNVPERMYYPAEGIDLNAGRQLLNGDESLQFVRYRSDAQGDLGRIERQQAFMKALFAQMLQMGNVFKIPALARTIDANVATNLSGAEITGLLADFNDDVTLETYLPPGTAEYIDGVSYYCIDETDGAAFFTALNQYAFPAAAE